MGRKSKFSQMPELKPPYPCHFGCGKNLETKYDREHTAGWEWFTGYGEHPLHFCPACRRVRQFYIDRIRAKLNIKPIGYPAVRASLDPIDTAILDLPYQRGRNDPR